MRFRLFGIDFYISYIIICAFLIFTAGDTTGQFLPLAFSVCIHEASHIIMLLTFGQKLKRAEFKIGALIIEYSSYATKTERIIALFAGPCSNLILALIARPFGEQRLFNINILLFLYNLLPVRGLDGGSLLEAIFEEKISGKRISIILNALTIAVAFAMLAGFIILLKKGVVNYSLILFSIYLVLPLTVKKFS